MTCDSRGEAAVVWVSIRFNRHGKPREMNVDRTEYFAQYEKGTMVSDTDRLNAIRASGLEQKINAVALEKASNGVWVDVPRPRPKPFAGTIPIDFYDDEWIPTLKAPIF